MARPFAATYDPNDPFGTDLNTVRTKIGDVHEGKFLLPDALITGQIELDSNILLSAMRCVDFIIAKLAIEADTSGGRKATQARSQRIIQFQGVKRSLRRELGRRAIPRVANNTIAKHEALDGDTTLVQPRYKSGMDDNGTHTDDNDPRFTGGE